ncbi:hypothetical protein NHX12_012120 [Muraenolepis orangiensis]|uniref:Uncharacterized protein n=1 Tax=Muraenolepis orangiensis TaxID=630683 RepID=A0A9Q0DJ99_9TELE|nr:hypothetical protein NHX12_012120 [Muraenolepis orangiensis]
MSGGEEGLRQGEPGTGALGSWRDKRRRKRRGLEHREVCAEIPADEDQETSGDFGSGGGVVLLEDQEEEPSLSGRGRQKKRRGRIHPRGTMEDDEDREEDKDDEISTDLKPFQCVYSPRPAHSSGSPLQDR